MKRVLLALTLCIMFCCAACADVRCGVVTHVYDGDTVDVVIAGRKCCVRLDGIDAPEKDQPFGAQATAELRRMFLNKPVEVEVKCTDKYGRYVARVYLDEKIDPDQTDASKWMLHKGLAWWYKQYSSDAWLAMLERDARKARRGLWKQRNPEAPWHYRHSK